MQYVGVCETDGWYEYLKQLIAMGSTSSIAYAIRMREIGLRIHRMCPER